MSILDAIGNTPLVEIKNIWKSDNVRIFAKVEGMNPGGSVKDRIAKHMLEYAIRHKKLEPGMTVLEATSGNTAIGLAMVCSVLGYPCTLVMPIKVSKERMRICKAYGANVILINGNMDDAIEHVKEMMTINPVNWKGYYNPNQFDSPLNWMAHRYNTGPEISEQLLELLNWTGYSNPNPTHFVAACGTTGTIMGCSKWFKNSYNCTKRLHPQEAYRTKIIAAFPPKNSRIQGLKNLQFSRVPKIYNPALIDESFKLRDADAFKMTKRLAREEGLFCGISSGAAMHVAVKVAKKQEEAKDWSYIVVVLPDNGYRYLSEEVF